MAIRGPGAIDTHRLRPQRQRRAATASSFVSRCKAEGGGKKLADAVAGRRSRRSRPSVRSGHSRRRGRVWTDPQGVMAVIGTPQQEGGRANRAKTCHGVSTAAKTRPREQPASAAYRGAGSVRRCDEAVRSCAHCVTSAIKRRLRCAPASRLQAVKRSAECRARRLALPIMTQRRSAGRMGNDHHENRDWSRNIADHRSAMRICGTGV